MKYLFRYMVIVLILISSTPVLAEDAAPSEVQTVEPAGAPPKVAIGYPTKDVTKPAENIAVTPAGGVLSPADSDVQAHVQKEAAALKKNTDDYAKNQEDCKGREDKANTFCMESRNPGVKKYLMYGQILMAGVSGMADACGKFGDLMDAGNKALTSYQALCSSWRGYCLSSCGEAVKNVQDAQKNLNLLYSKGTAYAETKKAEALAKMPPDAAKAAGYEKVIANYKVQKQKLEEALGKELEKKGDYMSIADKKFTCDGYAKELAASGLGMLSMAKSFGQANNCNKDTTNAATGNSNPAAVDCTLPANKKNNMTCICQDSPRMQGCSTNLDSTAVAKNADSFKAASTSDYVPTKANGNAGVDGGGGETSLASKSDGGSSLPGAPTGGGAAGIEGGRGTGSGPTGSQTGAKGSSLNTNILGGEGGGGGGGGSWGGSGSEGYGNGRGLRQFLPGGSKDPRALAGQGVVSKEVTSQGGKSNWEKVRERYRDNKPSLLGY
jgi:hypothetical protein